MTFFKNVKIAALGAALVLGSTALASAGTEVTVYIKNSLSTSITPSNNGSLGTVSPAPDSISSGTTMEFSYKSPYSRIAVFDIRYGNGDKNCRFRSTLTTNFYGAASWTKTGQSYGGSATCKAKITGVSFSPPYNYTVNFEIAP